MAINKLKTDIKIHEDEEYKRLYEDYQKNVHEVQGKPYPGP